MLPQDLSATRSDIAATSLGGFAILAGGSSDERRTSNYNDGATDIVETYDEFLTRGSLTALKQRKTRRSAKLKCLVFYIKAEILYLRSRALFPRDILSSFRGWQPVLHPTRSLIP